MQHGYAARRDAVSIRRIDDGVQITFAIELNILDHLLNRRAPCNRNARDICLGIKVGHIGRQRGAHDQCDRFGLRERHLCVRQYEKEIHPATSSSALPLPVRLVGGFKRYLRAFKAVLSAHRDVSCSRVGISANGSRVENVNGPPEIRISAVPLVSIPSFPPSPAVSK